MQSPVILATTFLDDSLRSYADRWNCNTTLKVSTLCQFFKGLKSRTPVGQTCPPSLNQSGQAGISAVHYELHENGAM